MKVHTFLNAIFLSDFLISSLKKFQTIHRLMRISDLRGSILNNAKLAICGLQEVKRIQSGNCIVAIESEKYTFTLKYEVH